MSTVFGSLEEIERVLGLLRTQLQTMRARGTDAGEADALVNRLQAAVDGLREAANIVVEQQQELERALEMALERYEELGGRAEVLESRLSELDDRLRAIEDRGGATLH
jgi:predicted  nucleic acid-binding Zn-ribbon protein